MSPWTINHQLHVLFDVSPRLTWLVVGFATLAALGGVGFLVGAFFRGR